MTINGKNTHFGIKLRLILVVIYIGLVSGTYSIVSYASSAGGTDAPVPVLEKGHAVDWWFVFKFNSHAFPKCGANQTEQRTCPFGGQVQSYTYSQQFVYASSDDPSLQKGSVCVGETTTDPLGATFEEVYDNYYYFVIWNDQFYQDPKIHGCGNSCSAPWGHSKGMLAWNDAGEGLVLQVTTPSWPAAGSKNTPRKSDGNTLGCIDDDNVKVSQHFFSLKLNKDDVIKVLRGLKNSSVVTDPTNPQIVNNGGPQDIQDLVTSLGKKSKSKNYLKEELSSGVVLISKPSALHVPPWQMVSAILGKVPLRAATWWARPKIYSTKTSTIITCWASSLEKPGQVDIATSGQWKGEQFSLKGGPGYDSNHAKIGVSMSGNNHYTIFGDMNQQGALSVGYAYSKQKCSSSQNGRGGLFFVLKNTELYKSVSNLIEGQTAKVKEN